MAISSRLDILARVFGEGDVHFFKIVMEGFNWEVTLGEDRVVVDDMDLTNEDQLINLYPDDIPDAEEKDDNEDFDIEEEYYDDEEYLGDEGHEGDNERSHEWADQTRIQEPAW
jgi:hypothetical protein